MSGPFNESQCFRKDDIAPQGVIGSFRDILLPKLLSVVECKQEVSS